MENSKEEEEEINILPKPSEIPKQTLGFIIDKLGLGFQIHSQNHHLQLNSLLNQITSKSNHLNNLHKNLGILLISWSSRCVRAKSSLHDFASNLETHYGSGTLDGRRIEKIVAEDLPYIANELRRIETLRNYAVVALELEGLVGDLEDAALLNLNQPTGIIYSKNGPSSSISEDYSAKFDNVHRAVKAINNIEELLRHVSKKHPHWLNLFTAVDTRVDKILAVLRPQVIADHRNLLTSLGWPPKLTTSNLQSGDTSCVPNPLVLMQGVQKRRYSQSFIAVCALQHAQSRREERLNPLLAEKSEERVGLWAIDELVSPIASRVNHHLMKWVDHPEFVFALVYKITRNFIEGVDDVLQPLIDEARLVSCSAKEAWVSAMVQVLGRFLAKSVFPILVERYRDKNSKSDVISSWLHLIDLIVKYEKRIRSLVSSETYISVGEVVTHREMSLMSLFCDRPDWVRIWAKVELKDAWTKLKSEIKDENAWSTGQRKEIQGERYFLSSRDDHKAPLVSEFALKQAWDMIERCRTLPGTSCRIRFVRSAVNKLLAKFREVLVWRYNNSKDCTYGFDVTLVRICQLINAARYLEFRLREWSDDVDIFELKLAEKGPNIDPFFEDEIDRFVEIQTDWVMEIITNILTDYENLSYYYFQYVDRFEVGPPEYTHVAGPDMVVSDDLAEALDNLKTRLLLVEEHLNTNDFSDVWRSVAEGLDRFTFRSILSVGIRFSDEGVKRLMADIGGLFRVFQGFCARPEAFFPCIRDFRMLLGLGKEEVDNLMAKLVENEKGCECLLSCNISSLSVDQAVMILNNRTFLV